MENQFKRVALMAGMIVLFLLVLIISSTAATAETIKLTLSGTAGSYKLSGAQPDQSEITFSVFCLDYGRVTPAGLIEYTWEHGGVATMSPDLLARAAWISRADSQFYSDVDKQYAIWGLSNNVVALSAVQSQLIILSAEKHGGVLVAIDLLIPVGSDAQRYLISSVTSSTPAEIPEPASLTLLGIGLLGLRYAAKKKS